MLNRRVVLFSFLIIVCCAALCSHAQVAGPNRRIAINLSADDVVPTGNEWISLPNIRASDAALVSFNVLSMRDRGLLEVVGENGAPVLQPYVIVEGKQVPIRNVRWELIEYWIPVAHFNAEGVEISITYCAPPSSRGAFLRVQAKNSTSKPISIGLGLKASWGNLNRVTYTPVVLRGTRTMGAAPWVEASEVFSFITHDTHFSWAVIHEGAEAKSTTVPLSTSPRLDAARTAKLAPGGVVEQNFAIGAGVEEFSSSHNAKALRELIDRNGADAVISDAAEWCRKRTRTTGQADLDVLMNRNYLFSAFYAWGRTIDTEQFVGVTSRSPRYYVSAAYWDRDAMLWSFPALLDIDPALARDALQYALGIQLRNTGIHSRFIDGTVLEDGFQLDEAAAPILAIHAYITRTNDTAFLTSHKDALLLLRDRLFERRDQRTGLYSTLQDSQDEYQKQPFFTYGNVLTWRAFNQLGDLFEKVNDRDSAKELGSRADALRNAILQNCAVNGAPGSSGPIFPSSTDAQKNSTLADVPPGSLMKLPALGFISEKDPLFARTYDWLHSPNYRFSYSNAPYGLPGSYRLQFTTSWSVADHLRLARGREQALKVLRTSKWDGGIISEGVHAETAVMDLDGRAFATAAGYVAHAICEVYCKSDTGPTGSQATSE